MNIDVKKYKKPNIRPMDPRFSSGPCKKHPGWDISSLSTVNLGRSHRAPIPRAHLHEAITRSAKLLCLPSDWRLAIVPASDTGAFELALWSMLGMRGVDVFVWERFSSEWAYDIQTELMVTDVNIYKADYGALPDLSQACAERDIVFVFNGTTSGVCTPDLDWIASDRQGIVFCDATSAVFAMELDYEKLDVVTWSWQKMLGGEGGFGMLALSPRAVRRLQSYRPQRPLPKIFRITRQQQLNEELFTGATINTPSMLALEDLHSALNWAESIGGLTALIQRCRDNFNVIDRWVADTPWIGWLARDPATRSPVSMCLEIVTEQFMQLGHDQKWQAIRMMCACLEQEGAAFDIAAYGTAPPGFRIWGGATIEQLDLQRLLPWLDWVYRCWSATGD